MGIENSQTSKDISSYWELEKTLDERVSGRTFSDFDTLTWYIKHEIFHGREKLKHNDSDDSEFTKRLTVKLQDRKVKIHLEIHSGFDKDFNPIFYSLNEA